MRLSKSRRQRASTNCDVFLTEADDVDAIIVNAAGCGAMLKDYGHLFHNTPNEEHATKVARKVKDISEFLMELGPVKPQHPLKMTATYHDACHLCHGQQIRKQPRQLLEMIPGLKLVPLGESEICCGAAGSYNLTQPEMADRLGRRKAEHILATGADAVFSANVGCLIQIGRQLRAQKPGLWIAHPINALWASYSGQRLKKEMLRSRGRRSGAVNLHLFLAALWTVIGIAILLPNTGIARVLPDTDPTLVGGFALMLAAYNIVRWRFTRLRHRLDEEARELRPPVRPRVQDEPPNPDFDFSDPKPGGGANPSGPRPGSG